MTQHTNKPRPDHIRVKLRELEAGDTAYVLNSQRNRAKEVEVTQVQDGIITTIYADERGQFIYNFDAETGLATVSKSEEGVPVLTVAEDPRVVILQTREVHRRFHERMNRTVSAYASDPTLENYQRVIQLLTAWDNHSGGMDFVTNIEAQEDDYGSGN